jgi:hypothetical protein
MTDKPAPKPEDDTYSDEEATQRRDATVRAMIGMKPKPHKPGSESQQIQRTDRRRGKKSAQGQRHP